MAHLADKLKALIILTKEATPRHCESAQRSAFMKINELAAKAPVLCYYCNKEEIIIQCDSSTDGLGVGLLKFWPT